MLCDWEVCGVELASFLVDRASADLASHLVANEEKLKSLRHAAGFSWNAKVMGAVGCRKLSAFMQSVVINPRAKELAKSLRAR